MKYKFHLNIAQKTKLIEILLIVGTILAAFELPSNMIWMFILFIFLSILYFIFIQTEKKVNNLTKSISYPLSTFFVGILIYNFGVSLIKAAPEYSIIYLLITAGYYFVFVFILGKALSD